MAQIGTETTLHVAGYKHGRVPREIRNSQLIDLAEELFIQNGFAGFTIDDLCRAAGVSRPTVYRHFGSKEGIYLACVRRVRDESERAMLYAAANSPDAGTALERGVEAFFENLKRNPPRWSLVYGGATGLVGPLADQLADLRDATVQRIAAVAAQYAPHAEPEQLTVWANAISGASEQVGRWWLRHSDVPLERVLALHGNFVRAAVDHLVTLAPEPAATKSRKLADAAYPS